MDVRRHDAYPAEVFALSRTDGAKTFRFGKEVNLNWLSQKNASMNSSRRTAI